MISNIQHFAMNYFAEEIDAPPSGVPDYAFTDSSMSARSMTISVTPFGDPASWIGTFSATSPSIRSALSGLFGTPSPAHLCVIERGTAFIVHVENPALTELVHADGPIVAVDIIANPALLLISTPWAITAIGTGQTMWSSQRLSIEGFRLDEVIDGQLFGVSDPTEDEPRNFVLDLRTGTIQAD